MGIAGHQEKMTGHEEKVSGENTDKLGERMKLIKNARANPGLEGEDGRVVFLPEIRI